MSSTHNTSSINLNLPAFSSILDPLIREEIQKIYFALQVIQLELDTVKLDIAALKQYNIDHQ